MPISWEEAGPEDRMLMTRRDNGDDWANIRNRWKEMTSLDTVASTLLTKYNRLEASMTILEDSDVSCHPRPRLLLGEGRYIPLISFSPNIFPKSPTPISLACRIG